MSELAESLESLAALIHECQIAQSLNDLAFLIEAKGEYYYDYENVKRWVLGDGGKAGNCDLCNDNADEGWIGDDDTFLDVDGDDIDGPPGHPNCFLAGTAISAAGPVSGHTKRTYEGEIIILRIPGVNDLACTPNHPILTGRGWVSACSLKISDNVFQCLDPSTFVSALNPYDHYIEARIENIGDSLAMKGGVVFRSVPVTAIAFHGDGQPNRKVDIVRTARTLPRYGRRLRNAVKYEPFSRAHSLRTPLSANRRFAKILHGPYHSTDCILCSGCTRTMQFLRRIDGANNSRFLDASMLQSQGFPFTYYGRSGHMKSTSEFKHALSAKMQAMQFRIIGNSSTRGMVNRTQPQFRPSSQKRWTGYADPRSDGFGGLAEFMRSIQIAEIKVKKFTGHVFNLQTPQAFYFANSILSHNCTCTLEYKEKRVRVYV
jgi:hypothetical protein